MKGEYQLLVEGKCIHSKPLVLYLAQVVHDKRRPVFPSDVPTDYATLAMKCWDDDPERR
jgi:hypothetical protein